MTKKIRNIIIGVGSAIRIAPASERGQILRKYRKPPEEALRGDWDRVGRAIKRAFDEETRKFASE